MKSTLKGINEKKHAKKRKSILYILFEYAILLNATKEIRNNNQREEKNIQRKKKFSSSRVERNILKGRLAKHGEASLSLEKQKCYISNEETWISR